MYYYEYEVNYYDECDECSERRAGVVCADTCAEAMDEIASFYGNDNINSVTLFPLAEDSCYEFSGLDHHFKLDIVD